MYRLVGQELIALHYMACNLLAESTLTRILFWSSSICVHVMNPAIAVIGKLRLVQQPCTRQSTG